MLAVTPVEAWWAHTVVLAAAIIDALASIPTGGLRGTDVLICRGDGEGSRRVPHTWHPDLAPRPRPRLCGHHPYYKPTQSVYGGVGETNNTELESGGSWPWHCQSASKLLGRLYLVCGSQFPQL